MTLKIHARAKYEWNLFDFSHLKVHCLELPGRLRAEGGGHQMRHAALWIRFMKPAVWDASWCVYNKGFFNFLTKIIWTLTALATCRLARSDMMFHPARQSTISLQMQCRMSWKEVELQLYTADDALLTPELSRPQLLRNDLFGLCPGPCLYSLSIHCFVTCS